MKCHQCSRPALYMIEDRVPLCLACYTQWHHTQAVDFLKSAAMINHSQDQMDIVTGISLGGDRIPVAELAKAFQRSSVLNNFNFTKPQIGVLNTGSIERIDSAITLSRGADTDEVAQRIKELTEAVVKCEDLGRDTKNEAIELADSLSTELVGSRQLATMTALAKAIKEKVGGVLALSNAADALWTAIESLFR